MPTPREFSDDLRARRTKRRLRWWLGIGGGALAVVTAAVLVWLFLFSPTFESRETAVEGTSLLTVAQVRSAAKAPMGVPLARIDLEAIEERVRALPEVRDVDASADFPNTVRIRVTERTPVYQLLDGKRYQWIDEEGIAVRSGQNRTAALPEARVGDGDRRLRADVATVVTHLPKAARDAVDRVTAKSVDRIEVALTDDRTIVWGSAEDSELKAKVLEALLRVQARVYDVSAPQQPTTR